MNKFRLFHDQMIQGKFTLQRVNLLCVFQVNCPGCFLYGIPMMNLLYDKFQDTMGFLGLSTAFEDFDLNTAANTIALIKEKVIIGETKKALGDLGHDEFPHPILFPVAMDSIAEKSFDLSVAANEICELNPNFKTWSSYDQNELTQRVFDYLKKQPMISKTFVLNQLRGTPSFVLLDEEYTILKEWFGHLHPSEVLTIVNETLERFDKDY